MKSKFDRIVFLKTTNLFAQVPEYSLMHISKSMHEIEAKAGTTIFSEGDIGDAVYLVVDGTVSIEESNIKLVTRSSGECVGEFALIDDGPRSTSVIAETDVLLLKWERKDFQEALLESHELALGILNILTGKLRQDVNIQVEAALEQERWRQDIRRAHEIQMAMLPEGELSTENIEISGYCRPAADVGGDYYDYLILEDDKLGMIISDVTGHGFYSGLVVAMAKSCIHTQAKIDYSADKMMEAMNRTISMSIPKAADDGTEPLALLMSCCYILIDFHNHVLAYSNAGHPYVYHYTRSTNSLARILATNMLLGIPGFEEIEFTTEKRKWGKGDLILLYSDGIPEAEDENKEPFGDERLENIILENKDEPANYIRDCILNAVSTHCKAMEQSDDITLVVAKAL